MQIPLIGLGTYNLSGEEGAKIIRLALDIGYRHIDTAHAYGNHRDIKKGIKEFERSKLFITSKFTLEQIDLNNIAASVEESCDLALKELDIDYLDLYLIHWPNHELPLAKIFKAIEKLVEKGKIRKAGVSNFNEHHLSDLLKAGCIPSFNQIEFHPFLYQKSLLSFCNKHTIQIVAYRPLGKGQLIKEPLFEKIGHKYKKNSAQVILRWIVQKGIPAIPKASSEKHLRENFEIFDFNLSSEEMQQIDALNRNERFCSAAHPEFNY